MKLTIPDLAVFTHLLETLLETMMADRITQLKSMLEKDPTDAFCMYGLGMEYANMGQHEHATAWFDRAIEADPNHSYAYFHKAKSQQAAGDPTAAEATLRQGLERAKVAGDDKALSEIGAFLDEMIEFPEEEEAIIDEREERPT